MTKLQFSEIQTVAVIGFGNSLDFTILDQEAPETWSDSQINAQIKLKDKPRVGGEIAKQIIAFVVTYKNLTKLLPKLYSAKIG